MSSKPWYYQVARQTYQGALRRLPSWEIRYLLIYWRDGEMKGQAFRQLAELERALLLLYRRLFAHLSISTCRQIHSAEFFHSLIREDGLGICTLVQDGQSVVLMIEEESFYP